MSCHVRCKSGAIAAASLALVLLLMPATATATNAALSAASIDTLRHDIDSVVRAFAIPGAAVALVSGDSIVWIGTFGFADVERGEPVTESTHFCIGSCTKSFTGLGFLKLLDEGRIDLDTPVRDIAPEIEIDNPWADTHPVRIVHLLEHTSGLDDAHPNWFYFEGPVLPLREALEAKAHLHRVRWPPGTRFAYSSPGYTLAGYILEKVTGRPCGEYLKQALLEPIGMTTSTIGSAEECRRRLAVGYDRNNRPFPPWYDYDEPAGAMNVSISEMALFVQFLLNRGVVGSEEILSAGQIDRIGRPTTTLAARAGLASGYNFGVGTRFRGGAKWYSHGGAVPGFLSEYAYNLDSDLGYVILQNSFDLSFYDDVFTIVRRYAESRVDSIMPPPTAPVPADRLESYGGYYEPRSPRLQLAAFGEILAGGLTVVCERDTLYTRGFMDTAEPLIPVSENLFRRPGQPEATAVFTRTADGKAVFATGGAYYEGTAGWKPVVYRILVFGAVIAMMSTLAYALFWIPVHVYKSRKGRDNRSRYPAMRVVPLLAVTALLLAVVVMIAAEQTMLQLGQKTPANVAFAILTWAFAGLSVLSLLTAYRSFSKPVRGIARAYAVIVSTACFGMALYLGYWGLIGLRLWAY